MPLHVSSNVVLNIRRSKLYYTASGIITTVGGRPVHRLRELFLFYNKFIIFVYMFRALCVHHQEIKIVLYSIWYHHNCRWPSGAQDERIILVL